MPCSECLALVGFEHKEPAMADLKFTNDKGMFEITNLSLEDLQKIIGLNGHDRNRTSTKLTPPPRFSTDDPDYAGFKRKLTGKAKEFITILARNANGISADNLASQLGFTSGVQLGGMAGGGLAKHALDCNIDLDNVYLREKKFVNGERRVLYKPGKDLNKLL
jgi:hypothetical protein